MKHKNRVKTDSPYHKIHISSALGGIDFSNIFHIDIANERNILSS